MQQKKNAQLKAPTLANESNQKSERIKKITDAVLSLPVLPTITAKILELVDNPNTSANVLSNLVSKDQVLTAKILKIANSAFYGFPGEIPTVKRAVVVLGFNSLREISLSMSIFNAFKNEQNNRFFNVSDFWRHSIAVGLGTRFLAIRTSDENMPVAFTAGLLHDLGKVVLNQYLPYEFLQAQNLVYGQDIPLAMAERQIFGVEHAQVGAWLAGRWKLPVKLVQAIQFHHTPFESENELDLCLLIHLADHLAIRMRLGASGNNDKHELSPEVLEHLENRYGFNETELDGLGDEIKGEFDVKASNLLSEVS